MRLWGTLTDISLHGCYVEMNTTFPVDTKVDLVLKSCGVRIQVSGTVRASYPFLGMGVGFGKIEPEQQAHLKELLAALGGQSAFFRGSQVQESVPDNSLRSADPRELINELVGVLSQESESFSGRVSPDRQTGSPVVSRQGFPSQHRTDSLDSGLVGLAGSGARYSGHRLVSARQAAHPLSLKAYG